MLPTKRKEVYLGRVVKKEDNKVIPLRTMLYRFEPSGTAYDLVYDSPLYTIETIKSGVYRDNKEFPYIDLNLNLNDFLIYLGYPKILYSSHLKMIKNYILESNAWLTDANKITELNHYERVGLRGDFFSKNENFIKELLILKEVNNTVPNNTESQGLVLRKKLS